VELFASHIVKRWLLTYFLFQNIQEVSTCKLHCIVYCVAQNYSTIATTTTTVFWPLDCVRGYPGEPVPQRWNQEGKTNLDLLEQETVSGTKLQ